MAKKYYNYLMVYTLHYVDRIKSQQTTIKATGRVIKSIKGGIKSAADLVRIEEEIRTHFLRTFPTLTECYITHYQLIGRTRDRKVVDFLNRVDLVSKETLFKTLQKFVDGYQSGRNIALDKTDEYVLEVLSAFQDKNAVN